MISRSFIRHSATAAAAYNQAERQAMKHHAAQTKSRWRAISFFVAVPCVAAASWNAYRLYQEHLEHAHHHPHEYVKYPYLAINKKLFPWGEGKKSAFFNDKVNHTADD